MRKVYVEGSAFPLTSDPNQLIGWGGEAEIYKYGAGTALKIYRDEDDAALQGNAGGAQARRQAIRAKLDLLQRKLPAFPTGLPPRVVAPQKLAYDTPSRSRIVGYTMTLVDGALNLAEFSKPANRKKQGVRGAETAVLLFQDLHHTLTELHQKQIVVGDFNPLNVLARNNQCYLIDADSWQFGGFNCITFTTAYSDPKIWTLRQVGAERVADLIGRHSTLSDWYSYAAMLWEALTLVSLYGGVYNRAKMTERPLRRISVFHPEVKYPTFGIHYSKLPDELVAYYKLLVTRDAREPFPLHFLERMRFRSDGSSYLAAMKAVSAPSLPAAKTPVPAPVVRTVHTAPTSIAKQVFKTYGTILNVTHQNGKLLYLYHENGVFVRETQVPALAGRLESEMKVHISGDTTVLSVQGKVFALHPAQKPIILQADLFQGLAPTFDANTNGIFWMENGDMRMRAGGRQNTLFGAVKGETWFWVGPRFGAGIYVIPTETKRVKLFTFGTEPGPDLKHTVGMLNEELLSISCDFTDDHVYWMLSYKHGRDTIHECVLVRKDGTTVAKAQSRAGEGDWLANLNGKCAANPQLLGTGSPGLLCVTANGIALVEPKGKQLEITKVFAGTKGVVERDDHLLLTPDGLYFWRRKEMFLIPLSALKS